MKTRLVVFLLTALLVFTTPASAETIRTYNCAYGNEACEILADKYPDLNEERWIYDPSTKYLTTAEYAAPLQTRSFNWDVFTIDLNYVDARLLMEKGFLCDLSDNAEIRSYIEQMHPSVAAQCMHNGKVYALPEVYWQPQSLLFIDMENWLAAGYTQEDIPSTFGDYLNFCEGYVERCEQDPDFEYVIDVFDNDDYDKSSWPGYFLNLFMRNYTYQCSYANVPLRFNDPTVIELMERIESISARLYQLQNKGATESYNPLCLFTTIFPGWAQLDDTRVGLRLSADQPQLIPMSMSLTVVNAATQNPELAADFAAALFQAKIDAFAEKAATVFQDAEPVQRQSFEQIYSYALNMVSLCEHRLSSDDATLSEIITAGDPAAYVEAEAKLRAMEDWEVRDELAYWKRVVESQLEEQWVFSPDDLAIYQSHVNALYFVEPSIFDITSESVNNYSMMWNQFCNGILSAREFCEQLDHIAWMMEMENQ